MELIWLAEGEIDGEVLVVGNGVIGSDSESVIVLGYLAVGGGRTKAASVAGGISNVGIRGSDGGLGFFDGEIPTLASNIPKQLIVT